MKVNYLVEKEDGSATIQANLNEIELKILIEFALNDLVSKGLFPFTSKVDQFIPNATEKVQ